MQFGHPPRPQFALDRAGLLIFGCRLGLLRLRHQDFDARHVEGRLQLLCGVDGPSGFIDSFQGYGPFVSYQHAHLLDFTIDHFQP